MSNRKLSGLVILILAAAALGGFLSNDGEYVFFISGAFCALALFAIPPGKLNTSVKCALCGLIAILFLISGSPVLRIYAALALCAALPDFKILLSRRAAYNDFKREYDKLEKKIIALEQEKYSIDSRIKNCESEIERYEKLYKISKDIEAVRDGRELAEKALETFSLKLGLENLAFFYIDNSRMQLLASKNLKAGDIDAWKKMLGKIHNEPVGSYYEFKLSAGEKNLGSVMAAGQLNSAQIKTANVIASQVAMGYEKTVLYEKVRELSRIDGLTGLFLRKYFMTRLDEEIERARRYDYSIAFFMCDLDDFKKYNDSYGHPMGDKVLRDAASAVKENIYHSDFAGRYGGEEICIYMPMADRKRALSRAEKIRIRVEEQAAVTVSIGIAYFPGDGSTAVDLIKAADLALYGAKDGGKNTVKEYSPQM